MRRKTNSNFWRRLATLTFLFIFVAGSFGLATVWLRQKIAVSGAETRSMERRLAEIERAESRYTGEIALALSPYHLETQNQRFELDLRQPREEQVVRVDAETQTRFAQFRWNQLVSTAEENSFSYYSPERN